MSEKIESLKHDYDTYKHLTSLSTGAIVILSAFVEKFFTNPEWKLLIIISIISFLISVVGSVAAMFKIAATMDLDDARTEESKTSTIIAFSSLGGFLVGIIALAAFTMKNFG